MLPETALLPVVFFCVVVEIERNYASLINESSSVFVGLQIS